MFHPIVCSNCQVEFKSSKNGVEVVDYTSFGPYKIWEADEWECPGCHTEVITGFADRPIFVNTLHDGRRHHTGRSSHWSAPELL